MAPTSHEASLAKIYRPMQANVFVGRSIWSKAVRKPSLGTSAVEVFIFALNLDVARLIAFNLTSDKQPRVLQFCLIPSPEVVTHLCRSPRLHNVFV